MEKNESKNEQAMEAVNAGQEPEKNRKSSKKEEIAHLVEYVPGGSYMGKHTTIIPKSGPTDQQVLAFWKACQEDGTLEALRGIRKEGADFFAGLCSDFTNKGYQYWIAVEADDGAEPQPGYEWVEARATDYAIFECTGPAHQSVFNKWKEIYNRWFPKSLYTHAGGTEVEIYPFGDMEAADYVTTLRVPVRERPPVADRPKRGDFFGAMPFVAIGCLLGVTMAGTEDKRLIGAILGGGIAWFVYSYVAKMRNKKKEKEDSNQDDSR